MMWSSDMEQQGSFNGSKEEADCTYGHVNGFWLQACEELPSQIDPLEVYVHPTRDFEPFPSHRLAEKAHVTQL